MEKRFSLHPWKVYLTAYFFFALLFLQYTESILLMILNPDSFIFVEIDMEHAL